MVWGYELVVMPLSGDMNWGLCYTAGI